MPTEAEVERMVVRIIGDGTLYQRMLEDAKRATQQTADAVDKASGRFANVSNRLSQLGSQIKSLGQGYMSQALALGGLAGAGATVMSSVSKAADAETLQANFKTLLKSEDAAKAMVANLQKFAADTPLGMSDIGQFAKQLLNVKVPAGEVVDTLRRIGDVAMGDAEKMRSLVRAYTQVKSARKLQGDELLQFQEANFNPIEEMSRTTGKSVEELMKLKEQGKITFDMLDDAFKTATTGSGDFVDAMKTASTSTGGLFSTMKDDIEGAQRALGVLLIDTLDLKGAMKQVSAGAQAVADWIGKLSPGTKEALGVVLKVVLAVAAVGAALSVVGVVLGGLSTGIGLIVTAFAVLKAAVMLVLSPVGLLVAAIGGLGYLLVTQTQTGALFFDWIKGGFFDVFDTVTKTFAGIKALFMKGDLEGAWKITVQGLKVVWLEFAGFFERMWADLGLVAGDFWSNLKLGFNMALNDIQTYVAMGFGWVVAEINNAMMKILAGIMDGLAEAADLADYIDPTGYMKDAKKLAEDAAAAARGGMIKTDDLMKQLEDDRARIEKDMIAASKAGDKERLNAYQAEIDAINGKITDEKKKLDEMVAAATKPEDAAKATDEALKTGTNVGKAMAKGIAKEMPKADALLFGSADALQRIMDYQDRLNATRGAMAAGTPGAGGAGAAAGANGHTAAADSVPDLLKDIRDLMKDDRDLVVPGSGLAAV